MIAVIYQGYIKLGMEDEYQKAWRKIALDENFQIL